MPTRDRNKESVMRRRSSGSLLTHPTKYSSQGTRALRVQPRSTSSRGNKFFSGVLLLKTNSNSSFESFATSDHYHPLIPTRCQRPLLVPRDLPPEGDLVCKPKLYLRPVIHKTKRVLWPQRPSSSFLLFTLVPSFTFIHTPPR